MIVFTGCGSGAHERMSLKEYAAAAQSIERRDEPAAARAFLNVVAERTPRSYCLKQVLQLRTALQTIVEDARALRPPADVEPLHERFLANAQQSIDSVAAAARQVERGDLECGDEMNRILYDMPSTQRAERVLEDMAAKGVPLCLTTCE